MVVVMPTRDPQAGQVVTEDRQEARKAGSKDGWKQGRQDGWKQGRAGRKSRKEGRQKGRKDRRTKEVGLRKEGRNDWKPWIAVVPRTATLTTHTPLSDTALVLLVVMPKPHRSELPLPPTPPPRQAFPPLPPPCLHPLERRVEPEIVSLSPPQGKRCDSSLYTYSPQRAAQPSLTRIDASSTIIRLESRQTSPPLNPLLTLPSPASPRP